MAAVAVPVRSPPLSLPQMHTAASAPELRKSQATGRQAVSDSGCVRRHFHVPSVAAAPLRADGCHAHCNGLTRAALLRSHTVRQRFPHGRFGMIEPSARVAAVGRTVRSPPLVCRRGIASASASEPRKSQATVAASRFGFRSARRRFHVPSVAAAPLRADGCHGFATGSHSRRVHAHAIQGRPRLPHGGEGR